jgi:PAS fold
MTIQTAFVVQPFTLAGRRNQRLVPLPKREVQSRDDYQGYGWSAAVHPDDAQPTIDAWNAAVAERRMFLFEHRVRRRGGAWGCFSVCAIPILGADGAVREWVGVHTDVTEQRAAEAVLRESEARAQAIVNSIDQMIWSTRRTATTTTTTTVVLHTRACRMARPTARRGTACSTPTIRSAPGPSGGAACRRASPITSNTGCGTAPASTAGSSAARNACGTTKAASCA